jgi:hypothetical protein
MLVRFMVADRTSHRSTCNAVVTRHVARDTADYGAFDTAFGVGRIRSCQAERYCYAGGSKECSHRSLLSSARYNKSTDAARVPNYRDDQLEAIIKLRRLIEFGRHPGPT